MRIGEVTCRTGVAARMLRYYEEQGLLLPERHHNGYRDYSEADVDRVTMIRDLSSAGVPTRFIKITMDQQSETTAWTSACDDALAEKLREQILDLDSKITCLTTTRRALTRILREAHRGGIVGDRLAADVRKTPASGSVD